MVKLHVSIHPYMYCTCASLYIHVHVHVHRVHSHMCMYDHMLPEVSYGLVFCQLMETWHQILSISLIFQSTTQSVSSAEREGERERGGRGREEGERERGGRREREREGEGEKGREGERERGQEGRGKGDG